jgi:methylglutamate dehydrogenase subunit A
MATLPANADYVVVGAGVHGLSTAWHLAQRGEDVLVLDKTSVAAGASGIACGVIRNNYFQPAMAELIAECVSIWESDPEAFNYHGSGYVALGPPAQESDLTTVRERHEQIGYPSDLILGEREVASHMRSLFSDWRAEGLTVCLHEHRGGFAFNQPSMHALAAKAQQAGARIHTGVTVTGFDLDASGSVTAVRTNERDVSVGEHVVIAVGPWVAGLWEMLGLPDRLDVRTPDGTVHEDRPMWTYWYLQEGEVDVDPLSFATDRGELPPVLHIDSAEPLTDDGGRTLTTDPWGIYVKRDRDSVQGGAAPLAMGHAYDVDPYPTGSVEPGFADEFCAALSRCLGRFEGVRARYRDVRSGGVGCFTADNFPVFDHMAPNVYVIADSNHGYKMVAVGREVARVLTGEHSTLLHPFRYERFATGDLHPVSHSPYPWS